MTRTRRRTAKRTGIWIRCLLAFACATALSAHSSVEVVPTHNSSRNVRLVLLVGGRPQAGVKVEAYPYKLGSAECARPLFSLTSDKDGLVVPPLLKTGQYHLVATSGSNLRAELYLNVIHKSKKGDSSFSMELVESPYPTIEQAWQAAEAMPVNDRLAAFVGTVHDPSGAAIAGVSIEVAKKGTNGKKRVAQIKSAADGTFSAQLPDGAYVALFSIQGFRNTFIPVEIAPDGSKGLHVRLDLGASTQSLRVASVAPSAWFDPARTSNRLSRGQRPTTNDQRPTTEDQRLIFHAQTH